MSIGDRIVFSNPYNVSVYGKIVDIVTEDNQHKYPLYQLGYAIVMMENWHPNREVVVSLDKCSLV